MKPSALRHYSILLICFGAILTIYGTWGLLRGEVFQSTARMAYGPSQSDEMDFVQSDEVLEIVCQKLHLNGAAGMETTGNNSATRSLRQQIEVSKIPKFKFMQIQVRDRSPEKAAEIANTIAEVYRDNRVARVRQEGDAEVRALMEQLNQLMADSDKTSALVFRLRGELNVSDFEAVGWSNRLQLTTNGAPDARVSKLRPYDEAWRDWEKQLERLKQFGRNFHQDDLTTPKFGFVTIVDPAVPSKRSLFPTHKQSLLFQLSGLLMMTTGSGLMLKAKRLQAFTRPG
jgi:hypothetical protein